MIGTGKWICSVNTIFFAGDVGFEIFDNNDKFSFNIDIPDIKAPEMIVKEVEEDDDEITITAETSLLPGKEVVLFLEFDDDTCEGYIKVPMVGKIKFRNGRTLLLALFVICRFQTV